MITPITRVKFCVKENKKNYIITCSEDESIAWRGCGERVSDAGIGAEAIYLTTHREDLILRTEKKQFQKGKNFVQHAGKGRL